MKTRSAVTVNTSRVSKYNTRYKSCVIGLSIASSVTIARSIPDFTAFLPPPLSTTQRKKPSTRWNVVSPSPRKRGIKNSKQETRASKTSSAEAKATTQSFGAFTANNFTSLQEKNIEIHTLILGTHPSIKSFSEQQYYGHPMNSFWWIAGDCLGFRRDEGVSKSGGPYKFASHLRHDNVIPYEQQTELLCSKGFALWDTVKSCHRPGSLDQDISKDVANDIHGFCQQYPSIRRIVLANGNSGCTFFKRHFKYWLNSGDLIPSSHSASQDAFSKWAKQQQQQNQNSKPSITMISALAVSPAAATYTYQTKRDFWDEYVYKPGLADHKKWERIHLKFDKSNA